MTQADALNCIRVRNKRIVFFFFFVFLRVKVDKEWVVGLTTPCTQLPCDYCVEGLRTRGMRRKDDVDSMWIRSRMEGQEEGQQKLEWSLPCRPTASSAPVVSPRSWRISALGLSSVVQLDCVLW